MSPRQPVRVSRILGAMLVGIAVVVAVGLAMGIRVNFRGASHGALLTWGAAPSGPAPTAEESLRMRDKVLTARFTALKGACASRWASDATCLSQLRQMSALEDAVFADIRAHEFINQGESDYWRGRLEAPSEIRQLLDEATNR